VALATLLGVGGWDVPSKAPVFKHEDKVAACGAVTSRERPCVVNIVPNDNRPQCLFVVEILEAVRAFHLRSISETWSHPT